MSFFCNGEKTVLCDNEVEGGFDGKETLRMHIWH